MAIGQRCEERNEIGNLGGRQRRLLSRLAVEGRLTADVAVVWRRNIVECANTSVRIARIPFFRMDVPLGVERAHRVECAEGTVVKEHAARRHIVQRRRAKQPQ